MEGKQLYIEDFQYILSRSGRRQVKVKCPLCIERRSNKRDMSLSINTESLEYHCHYCEAKGVLKSKNGDNNNSSSFHSEVYYKPKKKEYKRPDKKIVREDSKYSDTFLEFFKNRCISEQTLIKSGVTQEVIYFSQYKAKKGCISFNYFLKGEFINAKYRTREKDFMLIGGAELILYNIDSIHPSQYQEGEEKSAYYVEGEIDCLTLMECGYKHCISVPNGASPNLEYLDNYVEEYLEHLDYIYICVDNDTKGVELKDELLRRFGREKCRIINYPEPCKDINEVLMQYGKDAVTKCLNSFTELKPDGIQELVDVESSLDYLYNHGFEPGVKIGVPDFDRLLSFKVGLLHIITGVPSHGKAISLDTPLPSPNGWVTMGDVHIGDKLYDEEGNVCNVKFVTPIQYNRKCYKVTFSDNSEIICDAEHLWVTRDYKARNSELRYKKRVRDNNSTEFKKRGNDQSGKRTFPQIRNTEEIKNTLWAENGKRANHAVRVQGFLKNEDLSTLSIDPYTLGVWLADGTSCSGEITTGDVEVIENIKKAGYEVTKHKYEYGYGIIGFASKLKEIGILNNKMIPMQYLRANYGHRLALLKGLMDSDGMCSKDGTCEYSTSRKELCDSVYELVVSMGLKSTIVIRETHLYGVRKKDSYRITFRPNFNCFTLSRKTERIKDNYGDEVNWRYIKNVEEVESVPVKCIQVDSANSMYLCGKSMIPTHNTFLLNYVLSRVNILHGWKIAFFSPEFYPTYDHIGQMIETFGGKRFCKDNFTQMEYEAMKGYVAKNLFWIDPDDTDINSVLKRAEFLIKRRGIKALVIDPFNSLTDKEKGNSKQDEYISDFLQQLRWFARKNGVAIFLVMHPTKQQKNDKGLYPVCDLYSCKGAAEIYDKADVGITAWRNEQENYCEAHVTKVKFRHLGEKGHCCFKFNINNGRFTPIRNVDDLRKAGENINAIQPDWDNSNYILDKLKAESHPQSLSFPEPSVHWQDKESKDLSEVQAIYDKADSSLPFGESKDGCPF